MLELFYEKIWIQKVYFDILNLIMEGLPMKENKEQDLMRRLESFYFLPSNSIVDIICVYKKVKPATIIDIFHDSAYPEEYFHENVASVEEILRSLSLPYFIEIVSLDEEYEEASIAIAQNKESLEKVKVANASEEKDRDNLLGEAMGYPQTAIAAYIKGNTMELSELPEEIKNSDYIKFLEFKLSKDHWQEEIEGVKKRADTIRQTDPNFYNKIIKKQK